MECLWRQRVVWQRLIYLRHWSRRCCSVCASWIMNRWMGKLEDPCFVLRTTQGCVATLLGVSRLRERIRAWGEWWVVKRSVRLKTGLPAKYAKLRERRELCLIYFWCGSLWLWRGALQMTWQITTFKCFWWICYFISKTYFRPVFMEGSIESLWLMFWKSSTFRLSHGYCFAVSWFVQRSNTLESVSVFDER